MQRDVALFHDAFKHPNRIGDPGPLPLDRIDLRIGMIREEGIVELEAAIDTEDLIGVVDALIDTVYVSLGTLVEMGVDAESELFNWCAVTAASPSESLLELAAPYLAANEERIIGLELALLAQTADVAAYVLTVIAGKALQVLGRAGIDAQPFFDEVQRANMSKLGPDGEPIHSRGIELDGYPAGKALKGPSYVAPNLHAVYERLYG